MSATTITAKAARKTTAKKAPKGSPPPGRFTFWLDKKMTEASERCEAALASSEGFPAIRSVVEAWSPMHLETAQLDAAHSALEDEADADAAALSAANDAWMNMLGTAEEMSSSVLDLPANTAREAQAKIDTLYAMQGYKVRSEIYDDGTGNLIIAAMRRDLDLLATVASTASAASTSAWDSQVERTKDLGAAWDAADERLGDALMALTQNPAARMPDDLNAPLTPSEHALECADLTLAEKARRLPILDQWRAERERIAVEMGLPALEAEEQATSDEYSAAQDALIAAHPPHTAGLCRQLSIVISRMTSHDPDTERGIASLLQDRDYAEYSELAQIYVHASRLAGHDGAAANFKPFDPEAWIAEFEAHPGHTMQVSRWKKGAVEPEYADPIAWGPDMPAYDAIMITDPEAIARGNAWVRAQYTDEQWAQREREEEQRREQLRQMPRDPMAPYIAQIDDQIERAYPEGHPERARLLAMLELRSERARGNLRPIARHMWIDLEPWQRALVTEFVAARPDRFPENRDWGYEAWIAAYQAAGGTLSIDQDGSVMIGSPYPPTAQQSRLRAVVEADENLRYYVDKAVKACGSVVIGVVAQVGGGE